MPLRYSCQIGVAVPVRVGIGIGEIEEDLEFIGHPVAIGIDDATEGTHFECANVGAIAASGVRELRTVGGTGEAALVEPEEEAAAFVERRTAGEERVRLRRATVAGERGEERTCWSGRPWR